MQQKLLAKAVADLQRNSTLSMQYASMQYAELAGDLAALAADLSKVGARVARWEWLAGGVDGTLPGGGGGVLGRPLARLWLSSPWRCCWVHEFWFAQSVWQLIMPAACHAFTL